MDTTVVSQKKPFTPSQVTILIVLVLILIGIPIALFVFRAPVSPSVSPARPFPTRSTYVTDTFTEDEFVRGWYWGPEKAVKGTPSTWEITKVGTKFCWHLPIVMCRE